MNVASSVTIVLDMAGTPGKGRDVAGRAKAQAGGSRRSELPRKLTSCRSRRPGMREFASLFRAAVAEMRIGRTGYAVRLDFHHNGTTDMTGKQKMEPRMNADK